nr:uncharacterized protein LOC119172951 [Rhipicephalus microplus]
MRAKTQLTVLHFNENSSNRQAETERCCEQWPSFNAAFAANQSTAPPPMSHSFPRPFKHELVAARRSRFATGTGSTTL